LKKVYEEEVVNLQEVIYILLVSQIKGAGLEVLTSVIVRPGCHAA
jgi:hypothetical protein